MIWYGNNVYFKALPAANQSNFVDFGTVNFKKYASLGLNANSKCYWPCRTFNT